jgi:hypothetical protein
MGNFEFDCDNFNNVIDEMASLIINKIMGRATKLDDDVLIYKFGGVFCYVLSRLLFPPIL